MGFPGVAVSKELACQCKRCGFKPWVGKIPWNRKWQPIPVFLSGKSHGQRSLPGYCPWCHKELDTTKPTLKLKLQYFGHLMRRSDSLEKTLMLGKMEGRRRGQQRTRWLDGVTNSRDVN